MGSKTCLVTGASTGIGRATALHMDRLGWDVYAGVRKEVDGEALKSEGSSRLIPVIIDVADGASIRAAAETVDKATAGLGLGGLVNNAGITVQSPLEYLDIDELRKQLDVNVTGQVAVTQAFLPAIRKARGRIVFMSSIAGRARALPLIGPYSASKRALEALAEALQDELAPWDIKVALIEPGSIATPIWDKGDATFDDIVDGLPEEGRERYQRAMDKGRELAAQTGRRGIPPERVAEKVARALTAARPRFRYLVGADAQARARVEPLVPSWVRTRATKRMLFGKPDA